MNPTQHKLNEGKLLTLISSMLLAVSIFLLTTLWSRVDSLDAANKERDKELAGFMLTIEHRLTKLEVK